MKVQHVDAVAHPAEAVRIAAEALLDGRVVVLPTDTVYGVAALPTDRGAVDELFIRKGRPADMLLAVLVADPDQARALAAPGTLPEALDALWPGPLTVVVERAAGADLHLGATSDTVGIRCPDHDLVRALAARVGPLATTSANRTGRPTPPDAEAAAAELGDGLVVLDGGPCGGVPSTVIDCTSEPARVLRLGALAVEAVNAAGVATVSG